MVASRALGRLFFFAGCWVFGCLVGCVPDRQLEYPPSLQFYPSAGAAGQTVLVDAVTTHLELSKCDKLISSEGTLLPTAAKAFSFYTGDGRERGEPQVTDGILVDGLELVGSDRLRLSLKILATQPAGTIQVEARCVGDKVYRGQFVVRSAVDDGHLVLSPDTLFAGWDNEQIRITRVGGERTPSPFIQGVTRVMFGDGNDVAVHDILVSADGASLTAKVSVSQLVLFDKGTSKQIEVSAVTGADVAIGYCTITSTSEPRVWLLPSHVNRPAHNEVPAEVSLQVRGQYVDFENPVTSDTDSVPGVSVNCPDNPGITVSQIEVAASDLINLTLSVSPYALGGITGCEVVVGDQVIVTPLEVVTASSDASIRLLPSSVPGCQANDCGFPVVVARGVGLGLAADWTVVSEEPDVTVVDIQPLGDQYLAVVLDIRQNSDATSGLLKFTSGTETVGTYVLLYDTGGHRLQHIQDFAQGERASVVLEPEQGGIAIGANAEVGVRSGTFFADQGGVQEEPENRLKHGIVLTDFEVAADAPTGPAAITVEGDGESLSSYFNVTPSGVTPHVRLWPQMVWNGLPQSVLTVEGFGGMLLADDLVVESSEPALTIQGVTVDQSHNRALVTVSPVGDETGPVAVLYFSSQGNKAAATVRLLPTAEAVVSGDYNNVVYRASGAAELSLPMVPTFHSDRVTATLFDGIGVRVERVHVSYGPRIKVVLSLEKQGPGGWVGLVLSEGGSRAVVPIHIVAADEHGVEDDSLTALAISDSLVPGKAAQQISVQLPAALTTMTPPVIFDEHSVLVHNASDQVMVRLVGLGSAPAKSTVLSVDTLWTAVGEARYDNQVPLVVSNALGAAVAFLRSDDDVGAQPISFSLPGVFQHSTASSTRLRLDVGFSEPTFGISQLLMVRSSMDSPEYDELSLDLVTSDNYGAWDHSIGGLLWGWSDSRLNLIGDFDGNTFVAISNLGAKGSRRGGDNPCDEPFVVIDEIPNSGATVPVSIGGASGCRLVVATAARRLSPQSWNTPDLVLSSCDDKENCTVVQEDDQAGGSPDPLWIFDADGTIDHFLVGGELGSAGFFVLNVRPSNIITRVVADNQSSYVDLEMWPGADLSQCQLRRRSPESGVITDILPLSGTVGDDRLVRVSAWAAPGRTVADTVGVTTFVPGTPFLVDLWCDGKVQDSLQVGGSYDETAKMLEGTAVGIGGFTCYSRIGLVVDTNDNKADFIPGWGCEP